MGIKLIKIVEAKQKIQRNSSPRNENLPGKDDPKYHFVVYVGRAHEQFVVPISYLNQPLFQELLDWAEEEFGFEHPMGIEIHIYNLRKIQNGNPMLAIMLSKARWAKPAHKSTPFRHFVEHLAGVKLDSSNGGFLSLQGSIDHPCSSLNPAPVLMTGFRTLVSEMDVS
ncbi:hypothetical protein LguiB_007275 [Lonicera macranthoides]